MIVSALVVATQLLFPIAERASAGNCISGPHEPLRVRRQPFMPMTSSKPRNPLEDSHPHCREAAGHSREEPT
jgi:hypothetical protein